MRWLFAIGFSMAFLAAALPARADALLQQALAPAALDMHRSWAVQRTGLEYDADGKLKLKTVAQFDGAQPPGKRWSLMRVNDAAPSQSETNDFQALYKSNLLPPTYAMVETVVTPDAQKLSENADEAQYRISQMPTGTTVVKGLDLSKYTIADVTVDKRGAEPFVNMVRVYAPKEFRPIPGGKVKRLERILRFAMGKDGIPLLIEHSMISDASILFKAITVRSMAHFSHQQSLVRLSTANFQSTSVTVSHQCISIDHC
jgi:hypothetical protein